MNKKDLVSIIIPSRNEQYTEKTVEDLLKKAKGEIEIFVILDGAWLKDQKYSSDPRVNYIHYTKAMGMRNAINSGVALSRGKYILKTDAHCMFDEGYDEKLKKYMVDSWVVIPRRYPLDPQKWQIEERSDDKYPIDIMILDENLQGRPTKIRWDNSLSVTPTFQGSCWFMTKDLFNELGLMNEEKYGSFWHEAQEIGARCKETLTPIMRNSYTWYAHWHKDKGRGYSLNESKEKAKKAVKEDYAKK